MNGGFPQPKHQTKKIAWVVNTAATIWPILVLLFSRQKLSHSLHQRLLIVNPVESRSHAHRIAKEEPLKLELQHFIDCVQERRSPKVSGESAKRALDLAFEITNQISAAIAERKEGL